MSKLPEGECEYPPYHMIKICSKCHEGVLFELFYKQKGGKWRIKSACKDCERMALNAYNATEKGKAMLKKHQSSPKAKATHKRYQQSDKGKAALKRVLAKYKASGKMAETTKKRDQTP